MSDQLDDYEVEEWKETTAKFDRDELVRGWRTYEPRLPRVVPLLKYAAKTDRGQVRDNNEDKFDYYEPEKAAELAARGCLFAVADGIGGALAGQVASESMLKRLIAGYYDHSASDVETALRGAIFEANGYLYSMAQMVPEYNGMGTTLTGIVFIEDRVVVIQVGDSRAYLLRQGQIRQVTKDHSWIEEVVQAGWFSRDQAQQHANRNVITRSIGYLATVQPDFFYETAQVGDVWVLCTDGLNEHVSEREIGEIAGRFAPSESARQLIDLANSRGGQDNITVFVIAVRDMLAAPDYIVSPTTFALNREGSREQCAPEPKNGTIEHSERAVESMANPPEENALSSQPVVGGVPLD